MWGKIVRFIMGGSIDYKRAYVLQHMDVLAINDVRDIRISFSELVTNQRTSVDVLLVNMEEILDVVDSKVDVTLSKSLLIRSDESTQSFIEMITISDGNTINVDWHEDVSELIHKAKMIQDIFMLDKNDPVSEYNSSIIRSYIIIVEDVIETLYNRLI